MATAVDGGLTQWSRDTGREDLGAGAGSTWSRRYFDPDLPREFRNLGFAQRPAGIALAMWTLVPAYGWLPSRDVLDVVVVLLIVASLVPLATAVKRLYRPPRKAKPAWLLEEEAKRAP
ncbi:hypothetical protein [Nonomuraea sp. NPDC049784]|uniref:hypothetical protein n=1 Tax=Nonomuraea sp. NPDC049784 TaxID=3154361 RepID=UPI003402B7FC